LACERRRTVGLRPDSEFIAPPESAGYAVNADGSDLITRFEDGARTLSRGLAGPKPNLPRWTQVASACYGALIIAAITGRGFC
jgi:hypothetical protein